MHSRFATAFVLALTATAHAAVPYAVLHTFSTATEGNYVGGQLAISGNFAYGVSTGGPTTHGNIYRFNLQTNQLNVLYNFGQNAGDPTNPSINPVIVSGNNLYGILQDGGASGLGAIYQYNLGTNALTVLHSFAANFSEGAFGAETTLTQSGSILYGVTHYGGTPVINHGVVFKLDTTNNAYTVLHAFNGNEGADPMGKLALSGNFLYGICQDGGTTDNGTVFKIDATTGAYTLLHTFNGATTDGKYPFADSVIVSGNKLLGMTLYGGASDKGTLYSLDLATNQVTLLHSFIGGVNDGTYPFNADLLQEGNLVYGVTTQGGTNDKGTVFQYNLNTNTFDILHSFTTINDADPRCTLVRSGDYLYGLSNAANTGGTGVIFSLFIPAPEPGSLSLLAFAMPLLLKRRKSTQ